MSTWQTDEVVRCFLSEADLDEIQEIIEEAGDEAPEALQEWVRTGDAPKSLYDAVMRFTRNPDRAFAPVDWDEVVERLSRAS
jgi:hypothetical protein